MNAFRIEMGLAVVSAIATVVFLFIPGQRHWAIATGFFAVVAFFAAMDEL